MSFVFSELLRRLEKEDLDPWGWDEKGAPLVLGESFRRGLLLRFQNLAKVRQVTPTEEHC